MSTGFLGVGGRESLNKPDASAGRINAWAAKSGRSQSERPLWKLSQGLLLLLVFLRVAFLANLFVLEGIRTAFVLASLPRRDGFITAGGFGLALLTGFSRLVGFHTARMLAVLARNLCLDATAFCHRTAGAEQKGCRTSHHRECFSELHSCSLLSAECFV